MGLCAKVSVAGALQGWLLWEETQACPHVRKSQFQTASNQIYHWPKLNSSATLVRPPLIICLQKGNSAAVLRENSEKNENETTLKSPRSVKEGEEVLHDTHEIAAFGEHHCDVSFCFPLEPHEGLRWSR